MLSLLLIRSQEDQDGRLVQLPRILTRSGDFLTDLNRTFKTFLSAENSFPLSEQKFVEFVDLMTDRLGMTEQDFIRFFETKSQINAERAGGGYSDGSYSNKDSEYLRFA
jgi:hypothetical protein